MPIRIATHWVSGNRAHRDPPGPSASQTVTACQTRTLLWSWSCRRRDPVGQDFLCNWHGISMCMHAGEYARHAYAHKH
jgi:hypothetical protein